MSSGVLFVTRLYEKSHSWNIYIGYMKRLDEGSLLKEYIVFAFSALIFSGSRFIVEMIAAKKLGPSVYGLWATFLLLISYCGNLHMGILNAIGREIPFNIAKENQLYIDEIKITALKVVVGTIPLFAILSILLFFYDKLTGTSTLTVLTVLLSILFFGSQQIYQFFQYVLRAEISFFKASLQQGITGILILAITLPLLYKLGLNGLVLGYALSLLLGAIIYRSNIILKDLFKNRINKNTILSLLKIGFPILAIGFLYLVITSVDRWLILAFYGQIEMGYYSFAYNIFSGGMFLLGLLANQLYPRLALEYGKNECHKETLKLLKKQIKITALIGCITSMALFILFPFIVGYYFENYMKSIQIASCLVIGLPFIGVSLAISGYFNVIGQQKYLLMPMLICISTNFIISIILIKQGFGSNWVAMSTALSYFIYCILLVMKLKYFFK